VFLESGLDYISFISEINISLPLTLYHSAVTTVWQQSRK